MGMEIEMKIIDINDLTLGQIREIREIREMGNQAARGSHSLPIGKRVFIRTVTLYYVGRLDSVTDTDLVLSSASWVVDTGNFAKSLRSGEFAKTQAFVDDAIVLRSCMIDVTLWRHALPGHAD